VSVQVKADPYASGPLESKKALDIHNGTRSSALLPARCSINHIVATKPHLSLSQIYKAGINAGLHHEMPKQLAIEASFAMAT